MTAPDVSDLVQSITTATPRPPIDLGDAMMRELQDRRARTLLCRAVRRHRDAWVRYYADDIAVTYTDDKTTAEWHPTPDAVEHRGGPLDGATVALGERILSESGGRAPEFYETPNGWRIPGAPRSDGRTTIYRRAGINPATGRWVYTL